MQIIINIVRLLLAAVSINGLRIILQHICRIGFGSVLMHISSSNTFSTLPLFLDFTKIVRLLLTTVGVNGPKKCHSKQSLRWIWNFVLRNFFCHVAAKS